MEVAARISENLCSRGRRECFGVFCNCGPCCPAERIEYQFHATGDSQFVEDANRIIPHRVFGQVELPRNLLISPPAISAVCPVHTFYRTYRGTDRTEKGKSFTVWQ